LANVKGDFDETITRLALGFFVLTMMHKQIQARRSKRFSMLCQNCENFYFNRLLRIIVNTAIQF